jgi:LysM repeat protein
MHPKPAALMLLSGAVLLSGCESDSPHAATAPPPSQYETVAPPIMQTSPPGNQPIQPGLAANQAASATPAQSPRPVRSRVVNHTVTVGESLWSSARKYETTVPEIREANQLSGDIIRAGQTLKVPTSMPQGDPFSSTTPAVPPPPLPPALSANQPSAAAPATAASTTASPVKTAPSSSWTVTPPVAPPTSSSASAPQYRIPEPVILPPPSEN